MTHIDKKHRDERRALPLGLQMKWAKLTGRRTGGEENQFDSARNKMKSCKQAFIQNWGQADLFLAPSCLNSNARSYAHPFLSLSHSLLRATCFPSSPCLPFANLLNLIFNPFLLFERMCVHFIFLILRILLKVGFQFGMDFGKRVDTDMVSRPNFHTCLRFYPKYLGWGGLCKNFA